MIDTAGTIVAAAEQLTERGATAVYCAATHGVFSGPAIDRLKNSTHREGRHHQHAAAAAREAHRQDRGAVRGRDHRRRHRRRVRGHVGVGDLRRPEPELTGPLGFASRPLRRSVHSRCPAACALRIAAAEQPRGRPPGVLSCPRSRSPPRPAAPPARRAVAPPACREHGARRRLRPRQRADPGRRRPAGPAPGAHHRRRAQRPDPTWSSTARLEMTVVKEIQRHPVRRDVTHVDFLKVDPEPASRWRCRSTRSARPSWSPQEDGIAEQRPDRRCWCSVKPDRHPRRDRCRHLRDDPRPLHHRRRTCELPAEVRRRDPRDQVVVTAELTRAALVEEAEPRARRPPRARSPAEGAEARGRGGLRATRRRG